MQLLKPAVPELAIERSRRYCRELSRAQARNFYYGMKLLPEPRRSAMFAVYAYMRRLDDIADNDEGCTFDQRLEALDAWQEQTRCALAGIIVEDDPLWPAVADAVERYAIPAEIFDEAIEGQRQDLRPLPFHNFAQLRDYCRRVAGVVGLASIHIWGYAGGEQTEALAIDRGIAFQLTNILRDLREDAGRRRNYLPLDELSAMDVSAGDLRDGGGRFEELIRAQVARAEFYYERSSPLEQRVSSDARPTLRAMTDIYHGLLQKIAADPQRVLRERISLSLFSKLRIGWRAARPG